MLTKAVRWGPLIAGFVACLALQAGAGVLKSLENELNSIVAGTEPYLVTVKGDGGWRNLVATGIVIDNEGHVITTAKIFESTGFNVTFKDGKSYPAIKVGMDNYTGLAVIKIQGQQFSIPNWKEARPLSAGEWVTLVGNTYNQPSTVNFGNFHATTEEGFLELSLNARPGSSGGAILNIDGELVGILVAREGTIDENEPTISQVSSTQSNALKLLGQMGTANGLSYAVPLQTAKNVAGQIIKNGKVRRGYLGISTYDISKSIKDRYKLDAGVIVSETEVGSPADSAGFEKGDIIVKFDSQPLKNRTSLFNLVRLREPGTQITLSIIRDGKDIDIPVRLSEAREESFMGNIGQVSPAMSLSKGANKGLNSVETELARLKKEIEILQTELLELKKDLAKKP